MGRLVLTRRGGETLVIDERIMVTVLNIKGNQVRIVVEAPEDVPVFREEIFRKMVREREGGQPGEESAVAPWVDRRQKHHGRGEAAFDSGGRAPATTDREGAFHKPAERGHKRHRSAAGDVELTWVYRRNKRHKEEAGGAGGGREEGYGRAGAAAAEVAEAVGDLAGGQESGGQHHSGESGVTVEVTRAGASVPDPLQAEGAGRREEEKADVAAGADSGVQQHYDEG